MILITAENSCRNRRFEQLKPRTRPPLNRRAIRMGSIDSGVQETHKGGTDYSMRRTVLESQEWQEICGKRERDRARGPIGGDS